MENPWTEIIKVVTFPILGLMHRFKRVIKFCSEILICELKDVVIVHRAHNRLPNAKKHIQN